MSTQREQAAEVAREDNQRYLAGLEHELAGYKRSGNKDRADQVEAEIKANGGTVPSGRKAPVKQTAAAAPVVVVPPELDEDGNPIDDPDADDAPAPPAAKKTAAPRRRIGSKTE